MVVSAMWMRCFILTLLVASGAGAVVRAQQPSPATNPPAGTPSSAQVSRFVKQHCLDCHNGNDKKGGLALDAIDPANASGHSAIWETVVRKLTARQMPPAEMPRPAEKDHVAVAAWLESS